jgi:hypothetical protein
MGNGGEAERGRLWGRLLVSHVDLLEKPCVINDVQPAKHELGHADTASQQESRSLDLMSGQQGSHPRSAYTAMVWGPRFVEKVFGRFGRSLPKFFSTPGRNKPPASTARGSTCPRQGWSEVKQSMRVNFVEQLAAWLMRFPHRERDESFVTCSAV